MISVAMLGGGADAAGYYLDRAAECEPAYYTAEVEAPGRWIGRGAEHLGLTGSVTDEHATAFAGLLAGRLPDGTQAMSPVLRADPRGKLPVRGLTRELAHAAEGRGVEIADLFADPELAVSAVELTARQDRAGRRDVTVDARMLADISVGAGLNPHTIYPSDRKGHGGIDNALRYAGAKVDVRRCGLDVAVSAPKSVSVLHGLADPAVATVVAAAHDRAVGEAFAYLDRHTSHGMRGHQGDGARAARIATSGLVAAGFTHHTSRADDPQLHTHLVIANLVHGVDGRYSAVDSRAIHRHARTAGCIYQAVLRGELTRELGVEWGPIRKGVAEIVGIPTVVLREFSQRRQAIEAELDRTAGTGRRAAQRATYRTRFAKTHLPGRALRASWLERVAALALNPAELITSVLGKQRVPRQPEPSEIAMQLFGPNGLTAKTTSFDRRDVVSALTETLPPGIPITGEQLEAAADRMLQDPNAVRLLSPAAGGDDGPRWSTAELLATEQLALSYVDRPCLVPAHDVAAAHAVATAPKLSAEQRRAVAGMLQSTVTIDVVVGPAGSGKTALLRTAAAAWRQCDVPVIGCALAAVTARRLEAATGIPTTTLARLLSDSARVSPATGRPMGLAPRSVVVVDEASMVGTRDLAALAHHVAGCGGKLVLVGDPAQLPEIDAGGLFAALVHRAQPLNLSANQRQIEAWEQQALLALRAGQAREAVDAYLAHGRITIGSAAADSRALLAADYVSRLREDRSPYDVVALASTKKDVAELNAHIRLQLQSSGHLGADAARAEADGGIRRYAVGELVVVTRNDHPRELLNGTRLVVTHVEGDRMVLTDSARASTDVPTSWAAEHLDYGYALTVHKAQGLTASVALVYGSAALCQQAGYVALSRGRVHNHLYTSEPSLARAERSHDVDDIPRFQLLTAADPADLLDALSDRLGRNRRQTLAQHQQPARTRGLARGYDMDLQHRTRSRSDDFGLSR